MLTASNGHSPGLYRNGGGAGASSMSSLLLGHTSPHLLPATPASQSAGVGGFMGMQSLKSAGPLTSQDVQSPLMPNAAGLRHDVRRSSSHRASRLQRNISMETSATGSPVYATAAAAAAQAAGTPAATDANASGQRTPGVQLADAETDSEKTLGHRRSISDVLSMSHQSEEQHRREAAPHSTGSPSEGAFDSELQSAFGGSDYDRAESRADTCASGSAAGSSGIGAFERRREAAAIFVAAAGGGRDHWRTMSSSPASVAMSFLQSMNEDDADKVLFNSTQLLISKDDDVPQSLLPFPVATLGELSNAYYDDDAAPLKEVRWWLGGGESAPV